MAALERLQRRRRRRLYWFGGSVVQLNVLLPDHVAARKDHRARQAILQLPDVSRPLVATQPIDRLARKNRGWSATRLARAERGMLRKERAIGRALRRRRHGGVGDPQPAGRGG